MAGPSPMLSLPLELVIEIANHCVEHDWPDDPNAEHIVSASSSEKYIIPEDAPYSVPWVNLTESSKTTVCNFRQVCQIFRHASWPALGTIIGDRHFRLSENGLKALLDVSAVQELVPYIFTLKFTGSEVHEHECLASHSVRHNHDMHGLDTEIIGGAAAAGKVWKDYKPSPPEDANAHLETAFKSFNKLENVRFNVPDHVEGEFLAIWLTPTLQPCSAMRLTRAMGGTFYNNDETVGSRKIVNRHIDGPTLLSTVLKALEKVQISLQDIQVSGAIDHDDFWRQLSPHHLRTLRIEIDDEAFPEADGSLEDLSLPAALLNMPNLEDLALIMDYGRAHIPAQYDSECEMYSRQIFRALQATSKLRRVRLEGHWAFVQSHLLKFIEQHASTLKCFILYGPVLNGDWLATFHGIAYLTMACLEYLSVKFALAVMANGRVEYADFDGYTASEFPHFTCATDFGPWFYLFPDEVEDEVEIVEQEGDAVMVQEDEDIDEDDDLSEEN